MSFVAAGWHACESKTGSFRHVLVRRIRLARVLKAEFCTDTRVFLHVSCAKSRLAKLTGAKRLERVIRQRGRFHKLSLVVIKR